MAESLTFEPDYFSPPGETLEDALEERGMTLAQLAECSGLSPTAVEEVICGRGAITPAMAQNLERVLGISARFWITRERLYREAHISRESG